MTTGTVTYADRVRAGDEILDADRFVRVEAVRRTRGRPPRSGPTLDFVTPAGVVRRPVSAPVRVRRNPSPV